MKKLNFYFITSLLILLTNIGWSQAFNFTVSPQVQCYSGNNTVYASLTATMPGANSYFWTVASTSCTPSFTTGGNGQYATFSFYCCGVYTILCSAFSNSIPIGSPVSKTVSINCGNTVSITAVPGSVCPGGSSTLIATGGTSYTWNTGANTSAIVVSPTATTCYTVAASGSSICPNSSSATKCVSVSPNPILTLSGNASTCNNSPITFVVSGANNYTWYPTNQTGSVVIISPSVTPCFSVVGTNAAGCVGVTGTCITTQSPNITVSGNSVICQGGTTTLSAGGALTYTWSNGMPFQTIAVSPTVTTCYTVTGMTSGGCIGSKVYCVVVSSNPNVTTSNNGFSCSGSIDTLYAYGASSYTWYPFNQTGSSIIITPTTSMCYTVVGSNGPGCFGSALGCFSVVPAPTVIVSGVNSICAGSSTTLTASGASSYYWLPNNQTGNGIVVSPSVSTCYTVIGYGPGGCSSTSVKCLSVTPSSVNISGPNSICSGSSATLTASGATSYTWQPGNLTGSGIVVSPTTTTCYTLTSNGGSGCSGSSVKCIAVNPKPTITTTGYNVCAGGLDSLSAYGASTYTWYPFNLTGSSIVVTATANTCYTVYGTNNFGCVNFANNCFTVAPAPTVVVSGNSSICSGSSTTLTASGASNYIWYPGNISGSSIVVSPTASTCYTVVGNNGNSTCFGTAIKCVSVQPSYVTISGSGNICIGGSATLTASGSVSYTWVPGNLTGNSIVVSPSVSTCYTVIGYNGSGCTSIGIKCVTVSTQPVLTVLGGNTVCQYNWLTLTASGASSYTWLPGGQTTPSISPTFSANTCYTLIGSNGLGCVGSTVKCVSVTPNPTITLTGNTTICAGGSTTLFASGASAYTWMPANLTGPVITITPSVSTCYSVVGLNSFGCTGVSGICVNVQSPLNITISGNSNVCAGSVLSYTASGATTYTWPGGASGNVFTLTPLNGTCIPVMGSNGGCVGSAMKCFSVVPLPTVSIFGNSNVCSGYSTVLSASGANTYSWSSGATGSVISVFPTSNTCYTVTGTSSFGCTNSAVKCVTVLPSPSLSISGNGVICAGGSVVLTASGANNYTWSPGGQNTPSISVSPTASTCYTLTGSINSGCTSSIVKCVTVSPNANILINGNTNVCAGNSTTLTLSGANSYTWFPGNYTGSVVAITPSANTCFSIIGTNAQGCSGYTGTCINVFQHPTVVVSGNNSVCSGSSTTLSASGAGSYTWMPGNLTGPNVVVSASVSSCYTVTGSNGPGCSGSAVKCITLLPTPVITISGNNFICSGSSANYLASGASTYTWNTGSNSPLIVISPNANSCYTVAGTSPQGCIGSAAKCITVQATPNVYAYGDTVICQGASAFLHAAGASTYSWSTGATSPSILVTPFVTTTYTVNGTNGTCSGSNAITVQVKPSPTITVAGTKTLICAGESVTLTASGASTYNWWNNGSNGSSIVVTPAASVSYTVQGTSAFGCKNAATFYVAVNLCNGLEQVSARPFQLRVYPNPNNGTFNVIFVSPDNNALLEVYNTLGQLILSQKINSEATPVNLKEQAKGLYYIKVSQGSYQGYTRAIKE